MNEETNIYKLLDRLDEEITNGKKVALTGRVLVDGDVISDCVTDIRMNLPDIIKKASQIAAERNKIIGQAKEDASSGLARAKEKCEQMLAEANEIATKATTDAKNDATELIAKASEKAQTIVDEAEEKAHFLVSESEVVRASEEYAEQVKQKAEADAAALIDAAKRKADEMMSHASAWSEDIRTKTTTYIEQLMKSTDEVLVKNINDVRKLRNSFQAIAHPEGNE